MAATPTLDLLERALDQTGMLFARVRPDQTGLPTPCRDFDVHALLNHIVFDLQNFTAGVSGGEPAERGADLIGDDWTGAYDASRTTLLEAWRRRGVEGTITTRMGEVPATWAVGLHLADLAVHGWDVATATRQLTQLDPELARVALDWAHQTLKPEYRGQAFGPEVEVPENAPIYERLAGFFGRNPF